MASTTSPLYCRAGWAARTHSSRRGGGVPAFAPPVYRREGKAACDRPGLCCNDGEGCPPLGLMQLWRMGWAPSSCSKLCRKTPSGACLWRCSGKHWQTGHEQRERGERAAGLLAWLDAALLPEEGGRGGVRPTPVRLVQAASLAGNSRDGQVGKSFDESFLKGLDGERHLRPTMHMGWRCGHTLTVHWEERNQD